MNATPQTRRAILGAIGLAVPVAVAGGMATAGISPDTTGTSPELRALLEAERRTEQAIAHQESAVCDPLRARWLAACDALPHTTVEIQGSNPGDTPYVWTTANEDHVSAAKRLSWMGERQHPDTKAGRTLYAAHIRRERAKRTLAVDTGLRAAIERSNALGDERGAVLDAIAVFPAASLIDLQAKLRRLIEIEYLDAGGEPEFILADVNRILSREG